MVGNRGSDCERALLDTLSGAFGSTVVKEDELELERDPFTFSAAVVLFDEIDALLPALIHGQPGANAVDKSA